MHRFLFLPGNCFHLCSIFNLTTKKRKKQEPGREKKSRLKKIKIKEKIG